jgi:hypothetical protein
MSLLLKPELGKKTIPLAKVVRERNVDEETVNDGFSLECRCRALNEGGHFEKISGVCFLGVSITDFLGEVARNKEKKSRDSFDALFGETLIRTESSAFRISAPRRPTGLTHSCDERAGHVSWPCTCLERVQSQT